MSKPTLMCQEAGESAAVIEHQLGANAALLQALGETLRAAPPSLVVTCARGSSDHAANYAKYVLETRLGAVVAAASPAISSVYQRRQQLAGALFIAISQSGQSPDLLRSAEAAKAAGARMLALVNVEDSPLAALADTMIPLHAGPERSVAATKSYLASLAAILQLAACWGEDAELQAALSALPDQLRQGWTADWSALVASLTPARNLLVVGRGYGYPIAREAALKFKETCGLHGEAFSAAEVQHGPMALVRPGFPVLFFVQDDASRAATLEIAARFRARGAEVLLATSSPEEPGRLPLAAGLSPLTAPLVVIQSFYRAASALALARGHDPDLPPHLHKVTATV